MTSPFAGHEDAVAEIKAATQSGRLHHAWLLAGPRGLGKASFADRVARRLLAEAAGPAFDRPGLDVPLDHRIGALVDAGSHPDLMRLERRVDEKTGAVARSITIDQVRSLQRLFATTGSYSNRRIVIIDAIDDLERGGANALLKNLEEPPADSLFLLVSHAPGRLLPTIRSRCRILRFQPLGDDVMAPILQNALPDAGTQEIAALVRAGEGAPGRALAFAGLDIAALDTAIASLMRTGDPTNSERSALARSLSLKAAQPRYEAFLERATASIAQAAKDRQGGELSKALKLWEQARDLSTSAVPLSLDVHSTVFMLGGMLAALAKPAH